MYLLDRVGRRPNLLLGSCALLICMVVFTACIAVNTSQTANVALAFLFLYEISFGMSWNPIPWLYAPEITPLRLRHVGAATATFSEWLWTFVSISKRAVSEINKLTDLSLIQVIALVTPYALETAGWKFYLLFCFMIALSIPFTYFFLPEVLLFLLPFNRPQPLTLRSRQTASRSSKSTSSSTSLSICATSLPSNPARLGGSARRRRRAITLSQRRRCRRRSHVMTYRHAGSRGNGRVGCPISMGRTIVCKYALQCRIQF